MKDFAIRLHFGPFRPVASWGHRALGSAVFCTFVRVTAMSGYVWLCLVYSENPWFGGFPETPVRGICGRFWAASRPLHQAAAETRYWKKRPHGRSEKWPFHVLSLFCGHLWYNGRNIDCILLCCATKCICREWCPIFLFRSLNAIMFGSTSKKFFCFASSRK